MKFNIDDVLKLLKKVTPAAFIATFIILVLPNDVATHMHLIDFKKQWGFAVSTMCIISFSLIVTDGLRIAFNFLKSQYNQKKLKKTAVSRLLSLTDYQKELVCLLYIQPNNTYDLPIEDGAVWELRDNCIIRLVKDHYTPAYPRIPCTLQSWVIHQINTSPELNSLITMSEEIKKEFDEYSRDREEYFW